MSGVPIYKKKLEVDGWQCQRCGYLWSSRIVSDEEPLICARCKSVHWREPKRQKVRKAD